MAALNNDTPVGIIGAGTMGSGIAQVAAMAGHPVLLFDSDPSVVEQSIVKIGAHLDRAVEKGRMDAPTRDQILARIAPCAQLDALANTGLVIEAIVEDIEIKRELFRTLETIVTDAAILASNTSSLSVTAIAAGLVRPARVAGMHFFNPAPVMKLVEVVHGLETSAEVVETLADTATAWGKTPVQARSTPGFIVNRVARGFYSEALRVLAEGCASCATIDAVIRESGGFRMGPFELIDLIGVDVNLAVTESVYQAYYQESRFKPSLIQRELVLAGRLGRKTGQGFYSYENGEKRESPDTAPATQQPTSVGSTGKLGVADSLPDLIREAGIEINDQRHDDNILLVGDVVLALSDGRSATQRAAELGQPVVLFDLALDYRSATRIAIAPSDQCESAAYEQVVGLFQAIGKTVSVVDDCPGMLVMRSVAMLANEAAEAVLQDVAKPGAIDAAMKIGVNCPLGPLEWADRVGAATVLQVLDNLRATYGEERYRASTWLRRRVQAGQPLTLG